MDNFNSDFLIKFFFVEDGNLSRRNVLRPLGKESYLDILAPESKDECSKHLQNTNFTHAILDWDLVDWLPNDSEYIKVNGDECYDGLDITRFLKNHKELGEIILFSNKSDLEAHYENLPDKSGIKLLSRTDQGLAHDIISYIKKSHQLNVVVKPLHQIREELPNTIQSFFAKKLLSSTKNGKHFWKAGKYKWLVGVNHDISSSYSGIDKLNQYTLANPEEEFLLNVNKDGLDIASIVDESTNLEINVKSILKDSQPIKSSSLNHKYFITQAVCKKYFNQEIKSNEVIEKLKTLGEYAMFESQKILFKELSKAENNKNGRKKEIVNKLLKECSLNKFPRIIDILEATVGKSRNGIVNVKLKSLDSKKAPRIETFDETFLIQHNIVDEHSQENDDENSQENRYKGCKFEYSVYIPSIGGGSAYHIEPI